MRRPPVRHVILDFGGVRVRWQPQRIESVFIDDSSNNVESAARLGLRTMLFADSTSCAASLAEHLAA